MKAMRNLWLLMGASVCMAGCGTPQVALEHASNGVRLTQELQQELLRHKSFMDASAERRKAVVRRLDENTLDTAGGRAMDDYLDQASGRWPMRTASMRRLNEATLKYGATQVDEQKGLKEMAARLTAATKELPAPGEKLVAVQKTMAALGTELSAQDRFDIVQKFVGDAQEIVKKNADAAAAAASAPDTPPKGK